MKHYKLTDETKTNVSETIALEMLKVLEEVQNYVEMFGESHLTDMVNEVIAKAKGEMK